jgi:hypothetical protein
MEDTAMTMKDKNTFLSIRKTWNVAPSRDTDELIVAMTVIGTLATAAMGLIIYAIFWGL